MLWPSSLEGAPLSYCQKRPGSIGKRWKTSTSQEVDDDRSVMAFGGRRVWVCKLDACSTPSVEGHNIW